MRILQKVNSKLLTSTASRDGIYSSMVHYYLRSLMLTVIFLESTKEQYIFIYSHFGHSSELYDLSIMEGFPVRAVLRI